MQLFSTPGNKAPVHSHCFEILTQDNIRLRSAFAVPKNPKGTVLILGGRAEFIERYFETMNSLLARGLAVASFDWRGQGGSQRVTQDPMRGHIESFADFDRDLDTVYTRLLVAQCPKPFYALAHSTGGHMLLRALRGKKWLERAVITAPLLGLHFGPWPKPVARTLARGAKLFGVSQAYLPGLPKKPIQSTNFTNNPLTSDRKRWDRDAATLAAHPELGLGAPTYGWLNAALASIDELQNWPQTQGPSCPTLIAIAGLDKVVNNTGTKKFLARAPGFSSLTIADSRHEILNEKDEIRERFFAAFEAFISG